MEGEKSVSKGYDKATHLGFIQGTINRMAGNSFLCKGWAITLFSALLAFLFSAESPCAFRVLGIITAVIVVFWWLDSWYLRMERLFRRLYDQVRVEEEEEDPYSMSLSPFMDLEPCVLRLMFSCGMWPVYVVILVSGLTLSCVRRGY